MVPAFPVELSVAPPAPRSAVLPRPWSLMPEQRPPLPVAPLSKLRHRRWPEAVLPAAVPRVVPEQQAEVPPVAALVRVVPERAALVPVQTRLLSVAVPRQPVLRVAEPQLAPVPQAVLRQVPVVVPRSVGVRPWVAALPSVAVPRSVGVRPSVAVPRSVGVRPSVAVP
ncbi:hypothetical protein AB4Z39_03795, partial [Mycobacterium adipatum]